MATTIFSRPAAFADVELQEITGTLSALVAFAGADKSQMLMELSAHERACFFDLMDRLLMLQKDVLSKQESTEPARVGPTVHGAAQADDLGEAADCRDAFRQKLDAAAKAYVKKTAARRAN